MSYHGDYGRLGEANAAIETLRQVVEAGLDARFLRFLLHGLGDVGREPKAAAHKTGFDEIFQSGFEERRRRELAESSLDRAVSAMQKENQRRLAMRIKRWCNRSRAPSLSSLLLRNEAFTPISRMLAA